MSLYQDSIGATIGKGKGTTPGAAGVTYNYDPTTGQYVPVPVTQPTAAVPATPGALFGPGSVTEQKLVEGAQGITGGNTQQVSGSQQTGEFATQDASRALQAGQRQVQDTLGLGSLMSSIAPTTAATDLASSNFLLRNMLSPQGLQGQTQTAVNQALSGPGMQGVGVGAQGRAAGSAAANVGRNALQQQLDSANMLRTPGALPQTMQLTSPYLGESTQSLADTLQSTTGTSAGTGTQVGFGEQPQSTQSSGGGGGLSIICEAMAYHGLLGKRDLITGKRYAKLVGHRTYNGYTRMFGWLAKTIRKHYLVAAFIRPLVNCWVLEMAKRTGRDPLGSILGRLVLLFSEPLCHFVGNKEDK